MNMEEINTLVDLFLILDTKKKDGEIEDYDVNFDSENGVIDIKLLPKKAVEEINVDFTITPDGIESNE
jgi:hypothetical protein